MGGENKFCYCIIFLLIREFIKTSLNISYSSNTLIIIRWGIIWLNKIWEFRLKLEIIKSLW